MTPKQHAADSQGQNKRDKSKGPERAKPFRQRPHHYRERYRPTFDTLQTRKACKDIQNKDGSISIKDLKSLLDTQPANGPGVNAQVPAEHVRALVKSIIIKDSGPSGEKIGIRSEPQFAGSGQDARIVQSG